MLPLTDEERATYEWQIWTRGFGEAGQTRLKNSAALITRIGGLGGPVALELAAAGIGKLILAHRGNVKLSDLNRQILMTYDWVGKPRVDSAERMLKALNPRIEIETHNMNVDDVNARGLVAKADIVFDCAPLFEERFALNRACAALRKPLIDCAMFGLEAQVTTIVPGETACLACLYPEIPPGWKREFPVFGAVSAMAACIGVMDGIKLIAGMSPALAGKLFYIDTGSMATRLIPLARLPDCPVCGRL